MGAIIPGTGGITGTGTIIIYHGTAAITRHIIFITPEGGTKADTIIMPLPADRCAAEIAAAVMTAAADAAAAEIAVAVEIAAAVMTAAADAAVVAADGINTESL
jgi:hypothetical protein